MAEFTLAAEEVDAIQWAAGAVTAAAQAGDPDRRAARFADLRAILAELRARHGNQPVLLETEADFTLDPLAAADLYVLAERAAVERSLPTLTTRLSLARLLVEELGRPALAYETLLACQDELPSATDTNCTIWANLFTRCAPEPPAAPDATASDSAEPGAPDADRGAQSAPSSEPGGVE
jgi:hypothetical protein